MKHATRPGRRFRGILSSSMAALLALLAMGCASFRSGSVQPKGSWPPAPSGHAESRPLAFMCVRATMQDRLQCHEATENARQADYVRATAAKAASESGLFSRVGFDKATEAKADYLIDAQVASQTAAGMGTLVWAGLTGATLFIVPCTFIETITFTARVTDQAGADLAHVEYQEDVRTWFHLFMLPLFGKRPDRVYEAVWQDMFQCFFSDLKSQGSLK